MGLFRGMQGPKEVHEKCIVNSYFDLNLRHLYVRSLSNRFYLLNGFKMAAYRISSVIRQSFFLPKQSQRSRSVFQDGS